MKKSVMFLSLVIVLALALSGCSMLEQFLPSSSDKGSTSTESDVLFEDDFSKTSSGWDRTTGDTGSTDYGDGDYQILVNETQYDMWANPGKSFTDVSVEVDAVMVGGPEDNDFGLICRYQDVSNYYFGIISSDGYYAIGYVKGGTQNLFSDSLEFSDAIKQGYENNRVRLDCVGDTLTLYVNGTQLTQAFDSDFTNGDVGLMAGTFDTVGTQISFDNFVVKKP